MEQGRDEFAAQLQEMGYAPACVANDRVTFQYTITSGKYEGKDISIGLAVPPDYPFSPPSGPHLRPRFLPLDPAAPGHPERVADSDFGPDWQYLSRPFPSWRAKYSAANYLAFVEKLLVTL